MGERLVDDLLVGGIQLRVGEVGEHRSGAEEVIGVTVGQQDGLELLARVLYPVGKPLAFGGGHECVDQDGLAFSRDQGRRGRGPGGRCLVVPAGPSGHRLVATVEDLDGQLIEHAGLPRTPPGTG
ncbi:MAG TPA: hypothetical protein VFR22_17250 [Nocardioidaceae bacterium]|nr:hypothetical protein [Nocardioidaceae bacterium]